MDENVGVRTFITVTKTGLMRILIYIVLPKWHVVPETITNWTLIIIIMTVYCEDEEKRKYEQQTMTAEGEEL